MSLSPEELRLSILTINGGSSSIKFALYDSGKVPKRGVHGSIDRIGLSGTTFSFTDPILNYKKSQSIGATDHRSAADFLIGWLDQRINPASVTAVGHRIVHGGPKYIEPRVVENEMLEELRRTSPYDPEHMPSEIEPIGLFRVRFPSLPQVACFDTAFPRNMPRVARILPIPRRFEAKGIQRYDFHGLSYSFLMDKLDRIAGANSH